MTQFSNSQLPTPQRIQLLQHKWREFDLSLSLRKSTDCVFLIEGLEKVSTKLQQETTEFQSDIKSIGNQIKSRHKDISQMVKGRKVKQCSSKEDLDSMKRQILERVKDRASTVSVYREDNIDQILIEKCQQLQEQKDIQEVKLRKAFHSIDTRFSKIDKTMKQNTIRENVMVSEINESIQEDLGKIYRQCEVERRVREQTGSRLTRMIQQIGIKLQKEVEIEQRQREIGFNNIRKLLGQVLSKVAEPNT